MADRIRRLKGKTMNKIEKKLKRITGLDWHTVDGNEYHQTELRHISLSYEHLDNGMHYIYIFSGKDIYDEILCRGKSLKRVWVRTLKTLGKLLTQHEEYCNDIKKIFDKNMLDYIARVWTEPCPLVDGDNEAAAIAREFRSKAHKPEEEKEGEHAWVDLLQEPSHRM